MPLNATHFLTNLLLLPLLFMNQKWFVFSPGSRTTTSDVAVSYKPNPPAKSSHWCSLLYCSRCHFPWEIKHCSCGKHRGKRKTMLLRDKNLSHNRRQLSTVRSKTCWGLIDYSVCVYPHFWPHDLSVSASLNPATSGGAVRLRLEEVIQHTSSHHGLLPDRELWIPIFSENGKMPLLTSKNSPTFWTAAPRWPKEDGKLVSLNMFSLLRGSPACLLWLLSTIKMW